MSIKPFDVMSLGKVKLLDPAQMGYNDSLEIIKDESVKIQKSFVKIGWYLKHIRDNELFKEDGYANIYECAADQLGYSQSTTSRFINICEKFSKDHNSPELDTKYAGFDKSQMVEMLPMEPEQLEKVTPDMTISEIRAMKKAEEEKLSCSEKEEYATPHKNNGINVQSKELIESDDADGEDAVIDGTYREIQEEKSAYGFSKTEYPEGSLTKQEVWEQAELPLFKNNDQRKEWLKNYKEWGLWYRDENIDVNYYKFDFTDGSRLVVAEYPQRPEYWNPGNKLKDEYFYHLLEKNKKGYGKTFDEVYRHSPDCETYLVEFIKSVQKIKK